MYIILYILFAHYTTTCVCVLGGAGWGGVYSQGGWRLIWMGYVMDVVGAGCFRDGCPGYVKRQSSIILRCPRRRMVSRDDRRRHAI